MLDLVKRYYELKAAGVVQLAKIGDAYALSFKKFDGQTGAVLADDVVAIDLLTLQNEVDDLKKQATYIDVFIAEFKSLA